MIACLTRLCLSLVCTFIKFIGCQNINIRFRWSMLFLPELRIHIRTSILFSISHLKPLYSLRMSVRNFIGSTDHFVMHYYFTCAKVFSRHSTKSIALISSLYLSFNLSFLSPNQTVINHCNSVQELQVFLKP